MTSFMEFMVSIYRCHEYFSTERRSHEENCLIQENNFIHDCARIDYEKKEEILANEGEKGILSEKRKEIAYMAYNQLLWDKPRYTI